MHRARIGQVSLIALLATGCFHVTVQTGKPAGTVVDENWANSWIYGLVPPNTVETASRCPSGLSKVETEQSFLNGLVAVLTAGIYTPWTIRVTCAASTSALPVDPIVVAAGVAPEVREGAVASAVRLSEASGKPVFVRFNH